MKHLSHLQQSQWGKHLMWKKHTSRKRSQATWQPPPATMVYLPVASCAEALVHALHFMQHQATLVSQTYADKLHVID